jgi:hypothetical protein
MAYSVHLLLVEHVRDPEHTLPLLHLSAVEIEVGAFLVKSNAVRQPHRSCNEEVGGLWIWRSQQEQPLEDISRVCAHSRAKVLTIPRSACTLSRSVFRIVSSTMTLMAFLRYCHAFSSSSAGTRLLITRSRCAKASATFRLAHHPEPSYGSSE